MPALCFIVLFYETKTGLLRWVSRSFMLGLSGQNNTDKFELFWKIMKPKVRVFSLDCTMLFSVSWLSTHWGVFGLLDPPFISKARGTGTRVGQKGILQCEASAVPRADFEWYKEDRRWTLSLNSFICGIIWNDYEPEGWREETLDLLQKGKKRSQKGSFEISDICAHVFVYNTISIFDLMR